MIGTRPIEAGFFVAGGRRDAGTSRLVNGCYQRSERTRAEDKEAKKRDPRVG